MDAQQHENVRAQLVAAATKFNFAFRRIKIQTIERLTLFAYRWYLLTGPGIGANCVYLSSTSSLSLSFPSHLSRARFCSSHARPGIPLSEFSLCLRRAAIAARALSSRRA